MNLDRNLGKTNPLNENDLAEFVELQKTKADSDNSWSLDVENLIRTDARFSVSYDLSVKNPNNNNETVLREPAKILKEMETLDKQSAEILQTIRALL